jgi:hypothetical protein
MDARALNVIPMVAGTKGYVCAVLTYAISTFNHSFGGSGRSNSKLMCTSAFLIISSPISFVTITIVIKEGALAVHLICFLVTLVSRTQFLKSASRRWIINGGILRTASTSLTVDQMQIN